MALTRPANLNLLYEILIRIALLLFFCYSETMTPFKRVITQSELEWECMYPHKESYVPGAMLWIIVLSVPGILSLLAWAGSNDCNDAFEILLTWSLALGINGAMTNTVKLIVGRPRPDFFYRCFPDGVGNAELDCKGDPDVVMDGRKSFPSGHSSLAFCSLGVAAVWTCGRLEVLSRRRGSAARVLTTLAPLVAAMVIALSRSCDYHHHWQDILVGSLLGFTTAVFCYRQYYNPLSSELSGVPYTVSNLTTTKVKSNSPLNDNGDMEATSPLLNVRKEDKWI